MPATKQTLLRTTASRPPDTPPPFSAADTLVPDPQVFREFNISAMTGWRWDRDPQLISLGWPPAVRIRTRKFRSRLGLDAFKARLIAAALAERG